MMMHDSASCHTIIPTYFLHTKYHAVVIETFFMSSNRLCPHPWSQIQPPSDTPRFGDISQRHTWNSSWETLYWKKYLPNHRWRDRVSAAGVSPWDFASFLERLAALTEKSTYPTVSNVHALFYLEPTMYASNRVTFTLHGRGEHDD